MLFVNNRLDPVTPLKSARKMAERFEGSRVLMHDNVGHGALFPANECVWEYVREYLRRGEMPEERTKCSLPCEPFGRDCPSGVSSRYSAITNGSTIARDVTASQGI